MKIVNAFLESLKKNDTVTMERLDYSNVRSTIEDICEQYLKDSDDILTFEALPAVMDSTLAVLESDAFLEKYEFQQTTASCFMVRMRELGLL